MGELDGLSLAGYGIEFAVEEAFKVVFELSLRHYCEFTDNVIPEELSQVHGKLWIDHLWCALHVLNRLLEKR